MKASLAVVLTAALSLPALAAEPALDGYQIAKRASQNTLGFGGQTAESLMELYDAKGNKTVAFVLKQYWLEDKDKLSKSLIRFVSPPDTKGTGLLTHEEKAGGESRWLYLPETRQVKQLAGSKKSAAFKGSELAYEDLDLDTLEKYHYKLLGEETVGGRACYSVRQDPKFSTSGYSHIHGCYDKEHFYPVQAVFFDKSGQQLKVMTAEGYKKIGKKWRAHLYTVNNVQTGRKTIMRLRNYAVGVGLPSGMFTVSQLQK